MKSLKIIHAFEVVLSSRYTTGASTCIAIPELILNQLAKILLVVLSFFYLDHCECLMLDSFKLADSVISIYRNQPYVDVCSLTAL